MTTGGLRSGGEKVDPDRLTGTAPTVEPGRVVDRRPGGHRDGLATPFVVVAPVRPWRLIRLRIAMRLVRPIPSFRLDRAALIHVGQWGILGRPSGQPGRPGRLRSSLVFVSVFDGEVDQYIVTFATLLPGRFKRVFGKCVGYPGTQPSGPLLAYIRDHYHETGFFFSPYGRRTVCDIRAARWLSGQLRPLVAEAPALAPAELRARLLALAAGRDRDARAAFATPRLDLVRRSVFGRPASVTFTTLAPIRRGQEDVVRARLTGMDGDPMVDKALRAIPTTHYLRFAVVDPLRDLDDRPMRYAPAMLLFSVQFDREDGGDDRREIDAYLGRLFGQIDHLAPLPWQYCEGFVAHADRRLLLDFLRTGAVETGLYRAAIGASAEEIQKALRDDERFAAFRASCLDRRVDDASLHRRFLRELRGGAPMTIEWDDIQGNILRGYHFRRARFLFVHLTDPSSGLGWLRSRVVPQVVPPPVGGRQPAHGAVNVAFSHAGLAALGTDPDILGSFPDEFRQGMWARAGLLGDTEWQRDWCEQREDASVHRELIAVGGEAGPDAVHVLVALYADERAAIEQLDRVLRPGATDRGVRIVGQADLAVIETDEGAGGSGGSVRREHFGFVDGLSQPRIAGVREPAGPAPTPRLSWLWPRVRREANPVIQPGEFVLGYPDEDDPAPVLPEPRALFRNGSFLVVRKLAQDVPAFWSLMHRAADEARHAGDHAVTVDDIAAAVMGRDREGTPLASTPRGGDALRDFSYRHDPAGRICPIGSHVRRSNPRDGADLGAAEINRHRLLRRGMPYGPPSPLAGGADGRTIDLDHPDLRGDGVERGIFFLSFGTAIARQFEFVQRSWLNDGDALGIGHTADVISGAGDVDASVAVAPGRRLPRDRPVVTPLGGEYLFVPGLNALRGLAVGDLRRSTARVM